MQFIGFWRTKVVSIALARLWRSFVLVVFTTIVFGIAAPAVQAKAKFAAITVDARNGKLLYAENADAIRHPASLTKMMTLYVLFRDLKAGKIRLSSPIRMSARAASMAPSKLGVKPGKSITVETAIRALVVKSANDVAAAVAENLGGTERAFAQRMTSTARAIGMSRTTFVNASGLPDPAQVTTARDMATLGLRLMRDFPQYYPYFRTQSFVYNGRTIKGHNRLLGRYEGTDGIKTGYINASGRRRSGRQVWRLTRRIYEKDAEPAFRQGGKWKYRCRSRRIIQWRDRSCKSSVELQISGQRKFDWRKTP